MTDRILVAYATAHGSTRDIARRIGSRLAEHGLSAEVIQIHDVGDVKAYRVVVLGSAIHNRAWLPDAVWFVREHADVLRARPTWLFSVGAPAAVASVARAWAAKEGSRVMEPARTRIRPRGEHLFSGVLCAEHLSWLPRLVFRALGGRFGDFRDGAEIDGWATEIASELCRGHPQVSETSTGSALRVRQVMSAPVITVWADLPAGAAAALLVSHGYSAAPVVDPVGRLVGIVSEADLVSGRIPAVDRHVEHRAERRVAEVMTPSPSVVGPDESLADVVALMLDSGFRSIPVVDQERVVGILSRRDVLRAVVEHQLTVHDVGQRRVDMASHDRGQN